MSALSRYDAAVANGTTITGWRDIAAALEFEVRRLADLSLSGASRLDRARDCRDRAGLLEALHERGAVPTISYARWCAELSAPSGKYSATIRYGTSTHDAWRAGYSPDDYARAFRSWPVAAARPRHPIRAARRAIATHG